MKEYKSFGYDKLPPLIALLIVCLSFAAYTEIEKYSVVSKEFIVDNFVYIFVVCTVLILCTFNVVSVNQNGIKKTLYVVPYVLKNYKWSEIKHYAHVKEEWINSGKYQLKRPFKTIETIWFINFNDRVCLRLKKNREKIEALMTEVAKFEDQFELELKVREPRFMIMGLTKVNYPKKQTPSD